jgi:hypothetical protein
MQGGVEAFAQQGQSLDRFVAVHEPDEPRRHALTPYRHRSGGDLRFDQGPL